MEPKQGMKVPVKHPEELSPVVKRLRRSRLGIAPDRDILSDHGIWRLINGGNAAAAEWLIANVVDEDTCNFATVKTERGRK